MNTRLYRSSSNAMIAGVCGGLGEYLNIDPTFVRIFFVLLALGGNGIGVMVYLLLWIIVPLDGQRRDASFEETVRTGSQEIATKARAMGTDLREIVRHPDPNAGIIIGSALIILGGIFLIDNLQLPWLTWLDYDIVWPLLLIIGGIALLLRYFRGDQNG